MYFVRNPFNSTIFLNDIISFYGLVALDCIKHTNYIIEFVKLVVFLTSKSCRYFFAFCQRIMVFDMSISFGTPSIILTICRLWSKKYERGQFKIIRVCINIHTNVFIKECRHTTFLWWKINLIKEERKRIYLNQIDKLNSTQS